MSTSPPVPDGFVGNLRALGEGLLAGLQSRVELVSVELREEKCRLIQILVWISATVFAGAMALMFASLMLVYYCHEDNRLAALGGLTLFYTVALVAIIVTFRRYIARQPRAFAATLDELGKDRTCIRTKS